jgi:hypothetical protein
MLAREAQIVDLVAWGWKAGVVRAPVDLQRCQWSMISLAFCMAKQV